MNRTKRCHRITRQRLIRTAFAFGLLGLISSCSFQPGGEAQNPFVDLEPIELDGRAQRVTANLAPLGPLDVGDVLTIDVISDETVDVLVLLRDTESEAAGLLAGGAPGDEPFAYIVRVPGEYYLFLRAGETAPELELAVERVAGDPPTPETQTVLVEFADGFLTDPGLWDPVDGDDDDRALLASLEPLVREEIIAMLRAIFAGTPIELVTAEDPQPLGPFSRVTLSPERVRAENQDALDAALPPPDPMRPECQIRVIFGEVLPRGAFQDIGNRVPDDEAVVYVGSFQGRGESCWTATINSVNNIVLSLAQTTAHEIGHLVGLFHVEQIDIMNRSATLAFLRELMLARGQVQLDTSASDGGGTEVFTSIIQDPQVYFDARFGPRG